MKKPLQARILEILRDNPGLTVKDLSMLLEMDIRKTRLLIYELKNKGYVEKSGDGYIVTSRGEKYLSFIEQKTRETTSIMTPEQSSISIDVKNIPKDQVQVVEDVSVSTRAGVQADTSLLETITRKLEELSNRMREFENRLNLLESQVRDLEKAIAIVSSKRTEQRFILDPPVMTYSEALSRYGSSSIEKYISENKVVRIGSLIVDKEFYNLFRSRFPIKTTDLDRLTAYERVLLEEMRKEALVVLHSGKEYRLVE